MRRIYCGNVREERKIKRHELGSRDSDGCRGAVGGLFAANGDEIRRRDGGSDGLRHAPDYERQAFFCFLYLSPLLLFFSLLALLINSLTSILITLIYTTLAYYNYTAAADRCQVAVCSPVALEFMTSYKMRNQQASYLTT